MTERKKKVPIFVMKSGRAFLVNQCMNEVSTLDRLFFHVTQKTYQCDIEDEITISSFWIIWNRVDFHLFKKFLQKFLWKVFFYDKKNRINLSKNFFLLIFWSELALEVNTRNFLGISQYDAQLFGKKNFHSENSLNWNVFDIEIASFAIMNFKELR